MGVAVQLCFNCELSSGFVQIAKFHYSEASLEIRCNGLSGWDSVDTEQKDYYPSTE